MKRVLFNFKNGFNKKSNIVFTCYNIYSRNHSWNNWKFLPSFFFFPNNFLSVFTKLYNSFYHLLTLYQLWYQLKFQLFFLLIHHKLQNRMLLFFNSLLTWIYKCYIFRINFASTTNASLSGTISINSTPGCTTPPIVLKLSCLIIPSTGRSNSCFSNFIPISN